MNSMNKTIKFLLILLVATMASAIYWFFRQHSVVSPRSLRVEAWINNPAAHPDWAVSAGQRCNTAPFIMPSSGFIGFLWDDNFQPGHRHQGIDLFGGAQPGVTPVIAAYDGYLTRQPDWKSSVIIRIPQDPLNPQQQIWTYYTHMAEPNGSSLISPEFPAGTIDFFIRAGTILGYQGNYSGDPNRPVGVHLHFSIVKNGPDGSFRNELDITNTLDPSPYLGLPLNARQNPPEIPTCQAPAATP
jgi:murein DD-endopeptidase MepM/ murein hydrolase activator NlpD